MRKHKNRFGSRGHHSAFGQQKSNKQKVALLVVIAALVVISGVITHRLVNTRQQTASQNISSASTQQSSTVSLSNDVENKNNKPSSKTLIGANGKVVLPAKITPPPISQACKTKNSSTKALMTALKSENSLHIINKSANSSVDQAEVKRHQAAILAITATYHNKLISAGKCS